ncbi:hypothetical protein B9Z55_026043 [Caenorhabditis nigoni]|uniref:DUF7040 domain-containing protein n=1 Tax=Caenorhabditis nigoni TaxID=1611254 RepID=A0A2G5T1C0_9PELO|nr:hypothetical protein B9Z55_026043 [Caenorhabditis nigoni]
MIRSVQPVQIGKWCQHEVHDNRRIKETQVVNGNVQFQVEFPFDHDVLESLENRSIIDRFQRTKGLKKDIWEKWRFIQNFEECEDFQIRANHSRRGSGPSSKLLLNN